MLSHILLSVFILQFCTHNGKLSYYNCKLPFVYNTPTSAANCHRVPDFSKYVSIIMQHLCHRIPTQGKIVSSPTTSTHLPTHINQTTKQWSKSFSLDISQNIKFATCVSELISNYIMVSKKIWGLLHKSIEVEMLHNNAHIELYISHLKSTL